ncbi:MAG: AMP-binding protein [Sphingobacteriales bacterium]|nr:AMP-binding protein [Sphingobacteriales bacterium]
MSIQNVVPALATLPEYFKKWEKETPDAVFLKQAQGAFWQDISWTEAGNIARQLASSLRQMDLQVGDHVAILSKNCCHWILSDIALMLGGFVSVPFFPNTSPSQLRELLIKGDVKAMLVGKLDEWESLKSEIPPNVQLISFPHYAGNAQVGAEARPWEQVLAQGSKVPFSDYAAQADDIWTILFTSGTTGSPKGVVHRYRAPLALMNNELTHQNLQIFNGKEFRFFSYLPLNHIAERMIIECAALMTGGTVYFAESIDTFAKNLQSAQPNIFLGVPRIWTKFQMAVLERLPDKRLNFLLKIPLLNRILKQKIRKGMGLSAARIILTGAATCPQSLKQWYQKLDIHLQEVYAMTENCGGCTLMPPHDTRHQNSVGKPLPSVELRIDVATGEILMRAPWLMNGYYKDPEKTAEVLQGGWLHTGDMGEISTEGFLTITGRVADTFKTSKGKFIVPTPIEQALAKNFLIEQICLIGATLAQPLALVQLSENARLLPCEVLRDTLQDTLQHVNAELQSFEKIKAIVVIDELWTVENGALTPTLKIKRPVIHQRYSSQAEAWFMKKEAVLWENE